MSILSLRETQMITAHCMRDRAQCVDCSDAHCNERALTRCSATPIVWSMGSRESARSLLVSLAIASCGYPRPADVPDPDATGGPGYQLLAITPAIAMTGETVTLEGTFAATATVQFPGGAMQPATVLGEHRATVVVPETATAGDLTVTTDSVTVGPLPFRRTSFGLGLQPFRASYEQTDGARHSPVLRIARASATATVVKGWLYVVGGTDGAGAHNSVERAAINADGTIGSFELVGDVGLSDARSGHTSVLIGNAIFVIGGSGRSGALGSVERAEINADGSLGNFTPVTGTTLTTPRSGHTTTVVGNAVYAIGGTRGDGNKLASVERAVIQPDGSLGPFAIVPDAALVTARGDHSTELIGNALYILGGDLGSGGPSDGVERAVINPDGSLGAFSVERGTRLATPRRGHRTVVLGDAVYVLGGSSAGSAIGGVERAPITTSGSLGAFAAVSSSALSTARSGHALAVVGNWLYAIGGSSGGGPTRAIDRASLNADSALGAFVPSGVSLVLSRVHDTSVVIRDFIYMIGRSENENTVERAPIRADGSLGPFGVVAGVPLVTALSSHTTALIGRFLYVIGGSASGAQPTVERAVVNADGSLGPFATVSTTLKEARFGHVSVVLGDYLYVAGGVGNNGNKPSSVERAAINPDGTLGDFAIVSGVTLNTPRNYLTAFATDRYLYLIGGLDSTALDTGHIERAAINLDGSIGPFASMSPLIDGRAAHTSMIVGGELYVVGGLTPAGHVSSVERALIGSDGSLGAFASVLSLTAVRARHVTAVIGNSLYVIGGETEQPGGEVAVVLDVAQAQLR